MLCKIIRLETGEHGTFGVLLLENNIFCYTLEPQNRMNKENISRIPEGQYTAIQYNSPKFGMTYLVKNVYGREGILFHPGNTQHDTEGCILLGQTIDKLRTSERAVLNSGLTFDRFKSRLLRTPSFALSITSKF